MQELNYESAVNAIISEWNLELHRQTGPHPDQYHVVINKVQDRDKISHEGI